jgi:chaperonin GroES
LERVVWASNFSSDDSQYLTVYRTIASCKMIIPFCFVVFIIYHFPIVLCYQQVSGSNCVQRFRTWRPCSSMDGIFFNGGLTPIANNLLIKLTITKSTTPSGLYVPDSAKKLPTQGTVVAAGTGRVHPDTGVHISNKIKVGQNVFYRSLDGVELKYNNENHQLIKEDDVLLTYQGEGNTVDDVECAADQVLVKLMGNAEQTATGIVVETSQTKKGVPPVCGQVVKVGPGRSTTNGEQVVPVPVVPGEHIRFREFSGDLLQLNNEEYAVVKSNDILAKW